MMYPLSPSEKLDKATSIFEEAKKTEENNTLSQYQKNLKYASLMTMLEGMGIEFFMEPWKEWIKAYPNMELWEIYTTISKMRVED